MLEGNANGINRGGEIMNAYARLCLMYGKERGEESERRV